MLSPELEAQLRRQALQEEATREQAANRLRRVARQQAGRAIWKQIAQRISVLIAPPQPVKADIRATQTVKQIG